MFGQEPVPQAPCTEDAHCGAGWTCVDGNCVETPLPPLPPTPPPQPKPQKVAVSPMMVIGVVLAVGVVGIGISRGRQR